MKRTAALDARSRIGGYLPNLSKDRPRLKWSICCRNRPTTNSLLEPQTHHCATTEKRACLAQGRSWRNHHLVSSNASCPRSTGSAARTSRHNRLMKNTRQDDAALANTATDLVCTIQLLAVVLLMVSFDALRCRDAMP